MALPGSHKCNAEKDYYLCYAHLAGECEKNKVKRITRNG